MLHIGQFRELNARLGHLSRSTPCHIRTIPVVGGLLPFLECQRLAQARNQVLVDHCTRERVWMGL